MEKKYKLTEETIIVDGRTLHRIEALKDFGNVKKGDKGGFVENEDNLSQYDDCWIYDNAKVFDNAKVYGDAIVSNNVIVCDNAMVFGNAEVYYNARVHDNAIVCGKAVVFDDAEVLDNAVVYDNAEIYGNARVFGNAEIGGDAKVESAADYIVFKNWWSSGRYFTWTRTNNMWKVGCFYGTGEQLIEKAYNDSEKSGREYERVIRYVESIIKDYPK